MSEVFDIDSKYNTQNGGQSGQKRKRKTERELKILRSELRKNLLWTRESIKQMRLKYDSDFFMTEQQIYKWWWDQTRKRSTKAAKKCTRTNKSTDKENTRNCKDSQECGADSSFSSGNEEG